MRVWAGPLADAPALASEPPILILKVLFWRRTRLLFLFPHSSTASGILNLAAVSLSTGSPLLGPGQRRAVAFSITFFAVLGVAAGRAAMASLSAPAAACSAAGSTLLVFHQKMVY